MKAHALFFLSTFSDKTWVIHHVIHFVVYHVISELVAFRAFEFLALVSLKALLYPLSFERIVPGRIIPMGATFRIGNIIKHM